MGRTAPSYRIALEDEIGRLRRFRDALRAEEREAFDDMIDKCRLLASASGAACRPRIIEAMLLAIVFAHHKSIKRIEERLRAILRP